MNSWDIDKILYLLERCGSIAMHYYNTPQITVKSDNSIVTTADKEIEQLLASELDHPEESSYFIGEETVSIHDEEYLRKALQQNCWIIDPIDGTAPYSIQLPTWGISIGYMRNGVIIEGALYSPATGELIITNGNQVLTSTNSLKAESLMPVKANNRHFNHHGIISISQYTAKRAIINLSNQVFAWSGCVASFQHLIFGRILGYVIGAKLWDIAGALPILERLGFVIIAGTGEKVTTNICDGSFDLDFTSGKCWSLKGYAVAAPDLSSAEYIKNNLEFIS
jgi:fructose-1,6-bisphosphatase/inositol monophosphatase family enzyme